MKVQLMDLACTRSGDKGDSSNIGVVFEYEDVYKWALENLTEDKIKEHQELFYKHTAEFLERHKSKLSEIA